MAVIAGLLGVLLAFSSMLLSWYVLVPREDKDKANRH